MTRVWIAASEAVPFAKTGGLADVAGALAVWLEKASVRPTLVMPLYRGIRDRWSLGKAELRFEVPVGGRSIPAEIYRYAGEGGDVLFVGQNEFFDREGLYGSGDEEHPDNAARFAFFSRAVLELAERTEPPPDILHCHDWQTGLIPLYLNTLYRDRLPATASLFSIHNLGYQGIFGAETYPLLGVGPEYFHMDALEYWGDVCFLKAGIVFADLLSTVSPTYAREILTPEFGVGLDGVLRAREGDLWGILNGIDTDLWDPSRDPDLPFRYAADDLAGRAGCRRALVDGVGLDPDRPLLGVVSRLAHQKGIDILADAAEDLLRQGVNLVILGDGERVVTTSLQMLAEQYPHRISLNRSFDDPLARKIYAGADMFVMPSRYEPCGLGQMIALRYGAVPIVRATGGLADTVRETGSRPNGFVFSGAAPENLVAAIGRGIHLHGRRNRWNERVVTGMEENHSWADVVVAYGELYERAIRRRRTGR